MPYIKQTERDSLENALQELQSLLPSESTKAGTLNYVISNLVWKQFIFNPSYEKANLLIGVLEAVKLEFARRHVAHYEDRKIFENGDLQI